MDLEILVSASDKLTEELENCAFLPLCDGGCVVRRYNQYHGGEEYDSCPLDKEDFYDLLEMKLKMDCL